MDLKNGVIQSDVVDGLQTTSHHTTPPKMTSLLLVWKERWLPWKLSTPSSVTLTITQSTSSSYARSHRHMSISITRTLYPSLSIRFVAVIPSHFVNWLEKLGLWWRGKLGLRQRGKWGHERRGKSALREIGKLGVRQRKKLLIRDKKKLGGQRRSYDWWCRLEDEC